MLSIPEVGSCGAQGPVRPEIPVSQNSLPLQQTDLHFAKPGCSTISFSGFKDFQSQNRRNAAQQVEQPSVRVYGDTTIIAYAGWQEGIRDGKAFKSNA